MNKFIMLIMLFLISCSQSIITHDNLTTYQDGTECDCDSIYKSKWDRKNNNSSSMCETPYVNGKKNGIEKWYNEDGSLQWETPYVNGKKNGIEKWYQEDGSLSSETPYVNGKEKDTKYYYEPTKTGHFIDGESCNCDSIHFHLNELGYLIESPYKYGKENGTRKEDYLLSGLLMPDEVIHLEEEYVNGKRKGIAKAYYSFGVIKYVTTYNVNGKENGIAKGYYESGRIKYEIPYAEGKREGIAKGYYEMESFYESGYDLGVLMYEIPYVNGEKNGIAKGYYESGDLMIEIPLVNGNENGIVKEYCESGKLAGTLDYKNGKLVGYKHCSDGRVGSEDLDCVGVGEVCKKQYEEDE